MEKMQQLMISATVCIVILSNCLLYEARSIYAIDPSQSLISKRNIERRSFLKSFCARRCNIGKGGNVCRCNGFHFAGKRNSRPPVENVTPFDDADNVLDEEMIYKILEDYNKIKLQPQNREESMLTEQMILDQIQELLPQVLEDDPRVFRPAYGPLNGYYGEENI